MADKHASIRCGCLGILIGLLVTQLTAADLPARAAPTTSNTYVVNSALDEPDDEPALGVCETAPGNGICTLRAAIMVANYAAGPATILLPAGTYKITRPGYDNGALIGDYDISHDLTLQGAGSGATIVDGNGALTHDRVFKILSTTQAVTMTGMTIRNGQSLSSTVGVIGGGGIYMEGAGSLSLSDVVLEDNTAQNGGGLYANFSSLGGTLEMDHVSVRANTVTAGGVGAGGGVYAHLPSNMGAADLHDSQIYSNTADGTGGGLYVDGSALAQWSIERGQIYSNTAASGGGIGNFVPLAMADSRLHDNHASFDGGAIEAFSPYAITRSTLAANTAGRFGGAIFDLQTNSSPLANFAYLAQSTLSGNAAQYGGGIYHDGFITPGSLLTLVNSTLSGNVAFRRKGGTGSAEGGGLYVYGGQAQLLNATIAGNRVQLGFGPNSYPGIGGGLYVTATAVLTAASSLIANNTTGNGITSNTLDDCFSSGTTGTLGFDLILTTTNCFVTGPQGGLIVGQDPLLGPLQDNGGSTQTRALLPGSPAIDQGAPAGCTNDVEAPLTVDQRDAPRTDVRCDIGAFEVVPEADLAVGQHASSDPLRFGMPLTYTLGVTNAGPVMATGVVLTDTLPAGTNFRTVAASQGSCLGTVTIVCNLGSLANGAQVMVTVGITPTAAGPLTNLATATADQFDPALANNASSETTTVLRELYLPLARR